MKKRAIKAGKVRVEFMAEEAVRDAFTRATEYPEIFDAMANLAQAQREDAIGGAVSAMLKNDPTACMAYVAMVHQCERMILEVANRKQAAINPDGEPG